MALVTKHAIAPDDGTRVGEAWNRRVPEDIFPGRAVPSIGKVLPVCDAGRVWPPERRPTAIVRRAGGQLRRGVACRADNLTPWNDRRFPFREPRAVVNDHAPRLAFVGDQGEYELRANESETIATGTDAVAHRRGEQHQLVVGHLPRAVERRPALTFEREGSVSGKLEREETVVQRFRGKH